MAVIRFSFLLLVFTFFKGHLQCQEKIVVPEIQTIIDSARVRGSVLIYHPEKEVFYSNNYEWAQRKSLPASTFKIPNSIIALETGVVKNDSTLFIWDGQPRRMKIWEQDMIFREAFHRSCVPCYQEIARKVGADRMNQNLQKLNYPGMKVDESNIDVFWLEGESGISQYQQIDFLTRFYFSKLPIAESTELIMKRLMVLEETEQFRLSAKTGWSIRKGNNNGWFVGFIEVGEQVYLFATNVEPGEKFNLDMFGMIRKEITYKAINHLGIADIH